MNPGQDEYLGDFNSAAGLRAQAIEIPKPVRRRRKKVVDAAEEEEEEQLVDKTASLPLNSKKTQRLQKRQQKRLEDAAGQTAGSLLDLPTEIVLEILVYLRPSDVVKLLCSSKVLRQIILEREDTIAQEIIQCRYGTLYRCLPLPFALKDVPEDGRRALLNERRQETLNHHRKYYNHHVAMYDRDVMCTCTTCVFAWNNLCLLLDLNHWQYNLDHREPIPMIPRGKNPQWNQYLLQRNAEIVMNAMSRPLVYAFILEKHLASIIATILRSSRWKKKGQTTATPRSYQMTDREAEQADDRFLDRKGPPSYEVPFHRDNYYLLEVYLPNRKWSSEHKKWYYYNRPPWQHERDVEMVKSWMLGPQKHAETQS